MTSFEFDETGEEEVTLESLRAAAQGGDTRAQVNLAFLYAGGPGGPPGVPVDPAQERYWWQSAAERGHAFAQVNLAYMDEEHAEMWVRAAAEQGCAEAQYLLGESYRRRDFRDQAATRNTTSHHEPSLRSNLQAAVRWYRKAAAQGHLGAQYCLGRSFAEGEGVRQNYVEAARWYWAAANRGSYDALQELAYMYEHGTGVPRDHAEAAKLYRTLNLMSPWRVRHAEQWLNEAASLYGSTIPAESYGTSNGELSADAGSALENLSAAAAGGDAAAQLALALSYRFGCGAPRNDSEASHWFNIAAESGIAMAYRALGGMSEFALGTNHSSRSQAEAMYWYRKAAEMGDAESQIELGEMFWLRGPKPRDVVQAVAWFTLAAEQGDMEAQYLLGQFYAGGEGVERDLHESAKWRRRAAEQSHASAQYELARMYRAGKGVPRYSAEAVRWFRRAAEQGHPDACHALAVVHYKGIHVPQDGAVAAYWLKAARHSEECERDAAKWWA